MKDAQRTAKEERRRSRRRRGRALQRAQGAMAPRPLVAIVGRPNVGKSALFNRLSESRIAIVEDMPGVTRDRLYADAVALGRPYVLVDTGGFDPGSEDPMAQGIAEQVQVALSECELVVCVLDGSVEPLPADHQAVQLLRNSERPVIYVANKIDRPAMEPQAMDLYALGLPRLLPISALHGHGLGELEEAIAEALPEPPPSEPPAADEAPRAAIVGRPNAGKSSLANRLLGHERQLVDARPGTTVDSVDALLEWEGRHYVLIDTAGIRRRRSVSRGVEQLSVLQAIRALERSDVAVVLVDAERGAAEQDAKIAGLALERGQALVLALNKLDLLDAAARSRAHEQLGDVISFAPWAPVVGLSAKTGRGLHTLMTAVQRVAEARDRRVPTAEVNRFFQEVLAYHPPPTQRGRAVRLSYITQTQTRPPTFVIATNFPDYVHFSYRRYVVNQLRRRFGFEGTPIRVHYRKKS